MLIKKINEIKFLQIVAYNSKKYYLCNQKVRGFSL